MMPKRQPSGTDTKAQNKARKAYEEAVLQALRTFMETKEQADMAYKKELEQANDKQAKDEADIKYKETLRQARKVRDEVMDEAQKALNDAKE